MQCCRQNLEYLVHHNSKCIGGSITSRLDMAALLVGLEASLIDIATAGTARSLETSGTTRV